MFLRLLQLFGKLVFKKSVIVLVVESFAEPIRKNTETN